MISFPRKELEERMIKRSQDWLNISIRIDAALISSRIILTNKNNQKIIEWSNQKYTARHCALLLEKEKNNAYFNRNVKIAIERGRNSDADSNEDTDSTGDAGSNGDEDRNDDADSNGDGDSNGDADSNARSIPLFIKGLELLKKKSGHNGYHGHADHLVGLGKYCQGEILLLVDQISAHSMKHFSLAVKDPVDDMFDLSSLFYPEDAVAPVALVYRIAIERPVLFVK